GPQRSISTILRRPATRRDTGGSYIVVSEWLGVTSVVESQHHPRRRGELLRALSGHFGQVGVLLALDSFAHADIATLNRKHSYKTRQITVRSLPHIPSVSTLVVLDWIVLCLNVQEIDYGPCRFVRPDRQPRRQRRRRGSPLCHGSYVVRLNPTLHTGRRMYV